MDETRPNKTHTGARTRETGLGDHELDSESNMLDPDGFPSETDVIEMYELILSRFARDHARHIIPYNPRLGFAPHLSAACGHLRDTIQSAHPDDIPAIGAHLYANDPGQRLCLTCARHQRRYHKYGCNLCGHANFTESKLRRKTAVEFLTVYEPPLFLYIGVCRRCERILVLYQVRKLGPIGPAVPIA
jgi:hypothetical protein